MPKQKAFFIVFEGVEGSGKSYQSERLFNYLKKKKFKAIKTREPGGTKSSELIRNLILKDYFTKNQKEKFDKYTDTLLYLAARNEHIKNKIEPALSNNKVVICDRFIDSTIAYQVFGNAPEDIILVPGIISHVEFFHEIYGYSEFIEKLAKYYRVITFDKRGNGLSERISHAPTLAERMNDIEIIIKATRSQSPTLLGFSEGASLSVMYAAMNPDNINYKFINNKNNYLHIGEKNEKS
mgnify:CR=1 FL=1